jgi:hypothetical protein
MAHSVLPTRRASADKPPYIHAARAMLANVLLEKYSVDGVDYERWEPGQEAWTVS